MDAIAVLAQDHDELSHLLARVEQNRSDAAGQRQMRKNLVNRMVVVEAAHERLVAEFFWPVVQGRALDGNELVSSAHAKERSSKEILARLDRMATIESDSEFDRLLDRAVGEIRAYLGYEQDTLWPAVRAAVPADQLEQLGQRMTAAREATPLGYGRKS
jgi:hypothetical protein